MNFDEFYNSIYTKYFKELNSYYKKQKIAQIILCAILFSIYIIICIFIPKFIIIGFVFYIIIAFLCLKNFHNNGYVNSFKKNIISSILKNYDNNFHYEPKLGILSSDYISANFDEVFDYYHSEDYISGKLQEASNFKMAEIITEKIHIDENGKKSYSVIFKGLFVEINLSKNIPCNIQIRENAHKNNSSLTYLEMDSMEFENLYNVYTDNSIMCMQLFTSDIMQLFIDFKTKYKIFPEITISKNTLYLRFRLKKELFEPQPFKKVLDYKEIENNYLFINSIMNLCNTFLKNILETDI